MIECTSSNVSFLELKTDSALKSKIKNTSDPVFKTMVYGFPVPRFTSYMGDKGETRNSDKKYKVWELCPPGCISGVY